jgi:purine-cytosine permease-like protein
VRHSTLTVHSERVAGIPVLISFIILAGFAGRNGQLSNRPEVPPANAARVLSFITLIFGWTISWSPLAADFNTCACSCMCFMSLLTVADMHPDVSRVRVFCANFFGLYLPCTLIQMLGAAVYIGSVNNEAWTAGFESNSVGGLIGAVLLDAGLGNFGRFLLVIFALGMVTNNAPTIYSVSLNCQVLFPWFVRFPRWVFALVGTAIYLPLSIVRVFAQSLAVIMTCCAQVGSSSYTTALGAP